MGRCSVGEYSIVYEVMNGLADAIRFINQHWHWRWTYYVLIIWSFVQEIALILVSTVLLDVPKRAKF